MDMCVFLWNTLYKALMHLKSLGNSQNSTLRLTKFKWEKFQCIFEPMTSIRVSKKGLLTLVL